MKTIRNTYLYLWMIPFAASFAEPEPATHGKVIAASVVGDVEATAAGSKVVRSLKAKDVISEGHTVNVSESSAATLVFSNGSNIKLGEKTSLVISEFLQDPFSTTSESEEPSVSTMKLELKRGEAICDVKKLRTDKGSSMTINTPVGAAGVRGTTFAISYLPNADGAGKGSYTLSVTEGSVEFRNEKGEMELVEAGKSIEISFTFETDPQSGETKITVQKRETRNLSQERISEINEKAEKGKTEGGELGGVGSPLDFPGMDPQGNPLESFVKGGTGGGTTGAGGGIGGGAIGSLLGKLPAGGLPGGFFAATPGGGGDSPGASDDLGGGGQINNPGPVTEVNPPSNVETEE
jgi:hypothetical protein